MKKTKLSELFAYENTVCAMSKKAKVLVWNNRTMLIAEENSNLICGKSLNFDELIKGALEKDVDAVTVLLFAAMTNGIDDFTADEFFEYFSASDFEKYYFAVIDGLVNYLPEKEVQEQLKEMNEGEVDESLEGEEPDHWAFLFYFCKKYFSMTNEEFLNSTWRSISILQREFIKNSPQYKQNRTVSAEFVDI